MPERVPPVRWRFKHRKAIESSPVVGAGAVFAAAGRDIFALDKGTGKARWTFRAKRDVLASGALGGGLFMVGTDDRHFYALDEATGAVRWTFEAGEFTGGATVDSGGETVYVGSDKPALHAYHLNGTLRFEFGASAGVASTPALDGRGGLYFGDDAGAFYKLDSATGEQRWRLELGRNIRCPAKLEADGIFLATGDPDGQLSGEILRLDYDGSVRWRSGCDGGRYLCESCWTSPAVVGDVVIVACGLDSKVRGSIWGLSRDDGALLWRVPAGNDCQTSSPVALGDAVVLGCTDGKLYAVRAADGQVLWTFSAPRGIWATPALDGDGTLFVASHSGHLYALGGSAANQEL